jgi:hypothetical protein
MNIVEKYIQKDSPNETRYFTTINNLSLICLVNQTIESDDFWREQLKYISIPVDTKSPNNRTILFYNNQNNHIDSIYLCECTHNISAINHLFGRHAESFVTTIIDFIKNSIPNTIQYHILNEMDFKCFYYVPELENWRLPNTTLRRNTKTSILGHIYLNNQYEYIKRLVFDEKYDLVHFENKQDIMIGIFNKMSSTMSEILEYMKSSIKKDTYTDTQKVSETVQNTFGTKSQNTFTSPPSSSTSPPSFTSPPSSFTSPSFTSPPSSFTSFSSDQNNNFGFSSFSIGKGNMFGTSSLSNLEPSLKNINGNLGTSNTFGTISKFGSTSTTEKDVKKENPLLEYGYNMFGSKFNLNKN